IEIEMSDQQIDEQQQQQQQLPPKPVWTTHKLNKEHELRFEVDKEAKLKLTKGTAEYFGTELAVNREYTLCANARGAVFTWSGCELEMSVGVRTYIANETPMLAYSKIHKDIDNHRTAVIDTRDQGPRVLIAGPTDVGKSTLCKILLGYSARLGFAPCFVDLDPGQGGVTLPGALCATIVDKPVDIEEGLSNSVPFVQFYGHTSLDLNPNLYKAQIQSLALSIDKRCEKDNNARVSGIVVNTCGWIEGLGYEVLRTSITLLRINMIVVIDNEKLYSELAREYSSPEMKVMKLPKSGGVFLRSSTFRKNTRNLRIREYFYGMLGDLCPHITIVDFKDVVIYRTGGGPAAPLSALPIGATSAMDPLQLQEISPSLDMLHSILAVSYAKNAQGILNSNVAGFLYVKDVNMETKRITVLAPCPGDLPTKFLLMGTLKWLE
ncbi:hypothetical protein SAMD00019534_049480, partial [Acytostelium subglobosum LB1]|uniref:hypothetical protein n=1 Tax=Acytostelium subglobosum LB1 TaxID=1410327 RepID=UPI000644BA2F